MNSNSTFCQKGKEQYVVSENVKVCKNANNNCSNDCEKLQKFKAEGQELAKFLRSLEQFIKTVKVQNNSW